MPDEIKPPTETPSSTPPPPPAAAQPAVAPSPQPDPPRIDPMMVAIYKDFEKVLDADDGKIKVEPVIESVTRSSGKLSDFLARPVDEPVAGDQPVTPAAPVTPSSSYPKAPDPVKVTKKPDIDKLVQEKIDAALKNRSDFPLPSPTVIDKPIAPASDPFESSLNDDQKAELDLARFAATKNPGKFKDLPAQIVEYFKRVDGYVSKAKSEDPERALDGGDREFQKFLESNRPKISSSDRQKLLIEQVKEATATELSGKYRTEINEIRRKQHELEIRPQVEREVHEFASGTSNFMAKSEPGKETAVSSIMKRVTESGWDEAEKEDPYFTPIVRDVHANAVNLAAEYTAISKGAKPMDNENKTHLWLARFIDHNDQVFKQNGGDKLVQVGPDGMRRTFVPRVEFNRLMADGKAGQHWTSSDYDVLSCLAQSAKVKAEELLEKEQKKLENAGFKREKKAPDKKEIAKVETSSTPSPKDASPKSLPTASPGAASGKSGQGSNPLRDSLWSGLGLPAIK